MDTYKIYERMIILASMAGDTDVLETILNKKSCDINYMTENDFGVTAIIASVKYNRINCLKILLDTGADPNKSNNFGDSPLMLASCYGYLDCARLLLNAGADHHDTYKCSGFISEYGYTNCKKLVIKAYIGALCNSKFLNKDLVRHV